MTMRSTGWLAATIGLMALGLALVLVAAPTGSLAAPRPEPDDAEAIQRIQATGERGLHVLWSELPAQAPKVATAGAAWVRIEFRARAGGALDLARYDSAVDDLAARGVDVLGLVDYTSLPEDLDGDGRKDYDDPADYLAYQDRFTETLATLASHFESRIDHWEIWNEENGVTWHVPDDYYARLLVKSAAVLKAIDPNNQVLFGGLDHAWATSQYLEPVYDALDRDWGGARPFDILAVHPYFRLIDNAIVLDPAIYLWTGDPPSTILDPYLDLMAARGDADVDIWITEIGWNSALDNPAIENCPRLKPWCVTQATQAQYLHDSLDILLGKVQDPLGNRNRVKTVVWYQYQDTTRSAAELAAKMGVDRVQIAADPQAICPADWGLVDGDRLPKPAYGAYQGYTRPVTDVAVVSFEASARPSAVLLDWETNAETGLAGFLLYRNEKPGATPVRLSEEPIPEQGPGGAQHHYLDTAVALCTMYTYTLVAIVDGTAATAYGVAAAMPELPPPLVATNDGPVPLGTQATLTATLTCSAPATFTEASLITYTWSFADDQRGEGAVVTHTFPATGVYLALVTATVPASGTFTSTVVSKTQLPAELTATTWVTVTQPRVWWYLPMVVKQ